MSGLPSEAGSNQIVTGSAKELGYIRRSVVSKGARQLLVADVLSDEELLRERSYARDCLIENPAGERTNSLGEQAKRFFVGVDRLQDPSPAEGRVAPESVEDEIDDFSERERLLARRRDVVDAAAGAEQLQDRIDGAACGH